MENMSAEPEPYHTGFKYFEILSPEARMKIIDSMEPKDRCRYAECSHYSWNQARQSKEFIYELGFHAWSENCLAIEVGFFNYDETEKSTNSKKKQPEGFKMTFQKRFGSAYVAYTKLNNKELFRVELDPSTDLVEFTADHFRSRLQIFQNTIKKLVLKGSLFTDMLENYDFGLRSLRNLEVLQLCEGNSFRQFAPLIKHPLKELQLLGDRDSSFEDHSPQFFRVQHRFGVTDMTLSYEQFCQLSAMNIQMPIGYWTENDVANFITAWQNGRVRDTFKYCQWDLAKFTNSEFQVSKLFELLQLDGYWSGKEDFDIVQRTENGKTARLIYDDSDFEDLNLSFFVKNDEEGTNDSR